MPTTTQRQRNGSQHILFVDDDAMVRRVGKALLNSLGYGAEVAVDGLDAVDRFRDGKDDFDAVILDLTMPKLGGCETYAELRKIKPDVRVIISSGYSDCADNCRVCDGPAAFIEKPYVINTLAERLSAVLDS